MNKNKLNTGRSIFFNALSQICIFTLVANLFLILELIQKILLAKSIHFLHSLLNYDYIMEIFILFFNKTDCFSLPLFKYDIVH